MKCLLCKQNEANQTGSHIFTNSLIKSCLNVEGKTGRDDELIFSFSESASRDVYVGKTTSTDKIQQVIGRDLTDIEIEANNNKIVKDNIYCRDCEKLFGKIESPFTQKILNKIRSGNKYEFEFPENILIRLYFYIQIWRASSIKFEGWFLENSAVEEKLRQIILEACNQYDTGLSEELSKSIIKFPLIVNYLLTPAGEKSTNFLFIGEPKKPYYFFLCDFIIEFVNKMEFVTKSELINYYDVNENLDEKDVNFNENIFKVRVISDEHRKIIKSDFVSEMAGKKTEQIRLRVISEYKRITKKTISDAELVRFRDIFFDFDKVPIANRLSDERFYKVLYQVIEGK